MEDSVSDVQVIWPAVTGDVYKPSIQDGGPVLTFTPRQSQVELLEASIDHNTIVCLQTDLGKPFISVMLIKELAEHMNRRNHGKEVKGTVFLTKDASAAAKYASIIQEHTNLEVAIHADTSQNPTLDLHHVLVMTGQTFVGFLESGTLSLHQINLLVMDECHLALDESMSSLFNSIMQRFDDFSSGGANGKPRVLGMTSSILLGKQDPSDLEANLGDLERILKSRPETALNSSAGKFGSKPAEAVVVCEKYSDCSKLCEDVIKVLDDAAEFVDRFYTGCSDGQSDPCLPVKHVFNECRAALSIIGPLGVRTIVPLLLKDLQKLEKHETFEINCWMMQYAAAQLRLAKKVCDNTMKADKALLDSKFVTPKVRRLLQVFRNFKPDENTKNGDSYHARNTVVKNRRALRASSNNRRMMIQRQQQQFQAYEEDDEESDGEEEEEDKPDIVNNTSLCCIVFVERRYIAAVLDKLLRKLQRKDSGLSFISSSCIMGAGWPGLGQNSRMTHSEIQSRKQEEILRKFRRRETNMLFTTSVLEEGVDLPKCTLVVRFDSPKDYQSYVQSKGRARAPSSHYVILIDDLKVDKFLLELKNFQTIDKILQRKCQESEEKCAEEQIDLASAEALLPPFRPGGTNSRAEVSMITAIALVNRYCSKLPSDTFTHLTPRCDTLQMSDGRFKSTLYLPINSPVRKPIEGDPMHGKKFSQMAAALKTCKVLHKAGELDDNLLPIGKEIAMLAQCGFTQEVNGQGQGRPGTTKRRQYYDKAIARCLHNNVTNEPDQNSYYYLYKINMTLASPLPEVLNIRERKLHGPDETSRCFGFLTKNCIPKIPGFPVYTRAGEMLVSIDTLMSGLEITGAQQNQIRQFHSCILAEVLRLEKPNLEFDPAKADANYLILPLNTDEETKKLQIDWHFVKTVSECSGSLDRPPVLPDYSTTQYQFSEEIFSDAVVTPIYRNIDQPQRYYVAEILHDLIVTSPFPSEKYEKFVDYYFERYDIQVSNFQQPMIDVDCMSSRLNLLTPRYLNHKGKALPISNVQNKKNYLQKKQYLVPELCYIYPIPASVWRKAVCLPSVLYRLNSLLIAEELRVQIADEAGVGSAILPKRYPYPDLSFGWEGLDLSGAENEVESAISEDKCNNDDDERVEESNSVKHLDSTTITTATETASKQCNSVEHLKPTTIATETISQQSNSVEHLNPTTSTETTSQQSNSVQHLKRTASTTETASKQSNSVEHINPTTTTTETASKQCNSVEHLNPTTTTTEATSNQSNSVKHLKPTTITTETTSKQTLHDDSVVSRKSTGYYIPPKTRTISLDDTGLCPSSIPGPSPTTILQSLTMSHASDGFNLERLEMLGDSFLKQAVTIYLYCMYSNLHEGKLSYMRSKQVSNYNLYRLGKEKDLPSKMQVALFDPAINWLPPGFRVKDAAPKPVVLQQVIPQDEPTHEGDFTIDTWDPSMADLDSDCDSDDEEYMDFFDDQELEEEDDFVEIDESYAETPDKFFAHAEQWSFSLEDPDDIPGLTYTGKKPDDAGDLPPLPYEIHTQHSISDKSIADCTEALLGCYLVTCGYRSALLFMSWLGLTVLPKVEESLFQDLSTSGKNNIRRTYHDCRYGHLQQPLSPLLQGVPGAPSKLHQLLLGYDQFEKAINYQFKDKAYLLQAFTHASYHYNTVTDCYQRLEFLGDAILDYLITRHLFDHHQHLSPGALTDLRSALVNNTIFASLAVKFGYHKYFKALSPELFNVIDNFVTFVKEKNEALGMDSQLKMLDVEDDGDESEDIEVPKALGDIFESVSGAIYLDSGMSLDTVWAVYYPMMKPQIEQYAANLPISPVRELLEMEPETAKFGPPERTMDGKTRVTVNVVGKGHFKGIGRNYRIAKATAARCALRHLKIHQKESRY